MTPRSGHGSTSARLNGSAVSSSSFMHVPLVKVGLGEISQSSHAGRAPFPPPTTTT